MKLYNRAMYNVKNQDFKMLWSQKIFKFYSINIRFSFLKTVL